VPVRLGNATTPTRVVYRLTHEADGWRIYDIVSGGAQGIRRQLGLRDRPHPNEEVWFRLRF
jgi:hypothetical protein